MGDDISESREVLSSDYLNQKNYLFSCDTSSGRVPTRLFEERSIVETDFPVHVIPVQKHWFCIILNLI